MAIQTHNWAVGEVVTAANMNTYLRDNLADLDSRKVEAKSGEYTGDGTTSYAITGVGFQPVYVKIWQQFASGACNSYETTTTMIDDDATGAAFKHVAGGTHAIINNAIISLDADGFTVDDGGADLIPNADGAVYNYLAIG